MEIKRVYDYFFCEKSGIIIDDAYDLHKRNEYKKHINQNKEEFIHSQDNCIDYVTEFTGIKYISLPRDVEELNPLYDLKSLEGLCMYSSSYNRLDLTRINPLVKLEIIFDSNLTNDILDVVELKLIGISNPPDLCNLKFGNKLQKLELSYFGNLTELSNIPSTLYSLSLDYCLKLKDISCITNCHKLSKLQIYDCNKIENLYEILLNLNNIESLTFHNKETCVVNHLKSIKFIEYMPKLLSYISDYIIDDNNLNPLLKVKHKVLLRWKKKYNLREI